MRKFLILCAMLIFAVNLARAQDSGLPLCTAEQWDRMSEIRPRFNEMDVLFDSIETEAEFLAYIAAALSLRNDLWRDPPLCEPYIEIATEVSRIAEDNNIVSPMYWFHPDEIDTKRLLVIEEWNAGELGYLIGLGARSIASFLGLGPWHESEDDGALPAACSYEQKQRVIEVKRQAYVKILRAAFSVDTVEDLLHFDDEQLAFRATAYAHLPLCADAYDAAQRIAHISGDFVAAHALAFSGVAPDFNPSLQQILHSIEQLPAWIIPGEYRDRARVRRLFDNNLPACTEAQLAEVASISHPRFGPAGEFDESAITEVTRRQMLAYATIDIAWRADNLPRFPKCAEAFEIALLMSQTGTDIVAAAAISVSGAPRAENLYLDQTLRGVEALQLRLAQLPETTAERSAAKANANSLPACTIRQLRIMREMVTVPYQAVHRIALNFDGPGVVSRYGKAQFAWRKNNLRYLPACSGAIDLAYLLNSKTDNTAAAYALGLFARVITEANPYLKEIRAFLDQYEQMWSDLFDLAPH